METTHFSRLLEEEKATLESELSSRGKKIGADWQGSSADFEHDSSTGEHEAADQIEELATNVPLTEQLETRYQEVVDALARIEAGTFGVCTVGGEAIPADRLEANPAASTCIAHA